MIHQYRPAEKAKTPEESGARRQPAIYTELL